jgi:hypothetical protein
MRCNFGLCAAVLQTVLGIWILSDPGPVVGSGNFACIRVRPTCKVFKHVPEKMLVVLYRFR